MTSVIHYFIVLFIITVQHERERERKRENTERRSSCACIVFTRSHSLSITEFVGMDDGRWIWLAWLPLYSLSLSLSLSLYIYIYSLSLYKRRHSTPFFTHIISRLSLLLRLYKMESSLQISVLLAILVFSLANATATSALSPSPPPPPQTPFSTLPPPQTQLLPSHHDIHDQSFFSHTSLLGPILSHLGFNELAMAAASLSSDPSATTRWSGPSTLFAPSDSSIRTCFSCSVPDLLREHMVPGLLTMDYLRKLTFGTKIETLSPGRCVTVTSTSGKNSTTASSSTDGAKVFIGGVEITHPDLFNQGSFIIHGIQGFIAPLSPFSCDIERLNSLTFPAYQTERLQPHHFQLPPPVQAQPAFGVMRLMLRDAILKLRNNGFNILSLALRVKYGELVSLSNMTVFAVDDVSIFSGSHSYIGSVRFHIVPNHFLMIGELEKLPVGATLPTLERGQSLVITSTGFGGLGLAPMRINYVRIKVPEVMRNLKIVVHSVYLPFPRIHPTAAAYDDGTFGGASDSGGAAGGHGATAKAMEKACSAVMEEDGSCNVVPGPQVKPTVEIEDHHGL